MHTEALIQAVARRQEELIRLAKDIFEHPELALEERYSSRALADYLEANGFQVEWGLGGMDTAFVAVWGIGAPVLGFLAEYDALPNLAQPPVAAQGNNDGPGHGCGHHLIGAGCAAAAVVLAEEMERRALSGTIKVYGCPAEETMHGKVAMSKAGCFAGLDAAMTWHPFARNRVSEDIYQAMDSLTFRFSGISSHAAATPELGRSALDAAELMNVGVNYLREHVPDDVRMHYVYTGGGEKPNIVPDKAELWYFLRANSREKVDEVRARVYKVAQGAALMTETEVEMRVLTGCKSTKLVPTLNQVFFDAMTQIPLPIHTEEELAFITQINGALGAAAGETGFCNELLPLEGRPVHIAGSTDVSDVSALVPTVTLNAAAATYATPMHHWSFTAQAGSSVGYKAMLYAAQALAVGAMRLVEEPGQLEQIKAEFSHG